MPNLPHNPLYCDICDKLIWNEKYRVSLNVVGIKEKLSCHDNCAEIFLRCKGDFSKLPNGKLKRALMKDVPVNIVVKETGKYLTKKQVFHVITQLQTSHEVGQVAINNIAIHMYGLDKPAENEYYSLNKEAQLILMRKSLIVMGA